MNALPLAHGLDPTAMASIALFATGFVVGSAFRHARGVSSETGSVHVRNTPEPAPTPTPTPMDVDHDYGSDGGEIARVLNTLREQRVNTTCTWRRAGLLLLSPPPSRTLAQELLGPLQIVRIGEVFEWLEPFPYATKDDTDGDGTTLLQKLLQTLFLEMAKCVRLPPRRSLETPRKRTRFLDGTTPGVDVDVSPPSTPSSSSSSRRFAGHTPGIRSALRNSAAVKGFTSSYNTPTSVASSSSSSSSSSTSTANSVVPVRMLPPPAPVFRPISSPLTPASTPTTVRARRALMLRPPTPGSSPLKRTYAFYEADTDEEEYSVAGDENSPLKNKGAAGVSLSAGLERTEEFALSGPISTPTSAAIFEVTQPSFTSISESVPAHGSVPRVESPSSSSSASGSPTLTSDASIQ